MLFLHAAFGTGGGGCDNDSAWKDPNLIAAQASQIFRYGNAGVTREFLLNVAQ
jgi:hypothetical protein